MLRMSTQQWTRLPWHRSADQFLLCVCSHLNQTTSWTHPSSNVEHQSITMATGDAAAARQPPAVSMGKRSENAAPVGVWAPRFLSDFAYGQLTSIDVQWTARACDGDAAGSRGDPDEKSRLLGHAWVTWVCSGCVWLSYAALEWFDVQVCVWLLRSRLVDWSVFIVSWVLATLQWFECGQGVFGSVMEWFECSCLCLAVMVTLGWCECVYCQIAEFWPHLSDLSVGRACLASMTTCKWFECSWWVGSGMTTLGLFGLFRVSWLSCCHAWVVWLCLECVCFSAGNIWGSWGYVWLL